MKIFNNLKNQKELSKEEQEEIARKQKLNNKDYEKIYTAYYERIFGFVQSRVGRYQDAEDLTSLVFERVLRKLSDFQWQGITITSWIYRIARNAIIDHYRNNSERQKDASMDQVGDFIESDDQMHEDILIEKEEHAKLFESIKHLDEEDQYLIYYKFFEDLSNSEISELTGLSETNVGTKLHRLRKRLKQIIKAK